MPDFKAIPFRLNMKEPMRMLSGNGASATLVSTLLDLDLHRTGEVSVVFCGHESTQLGMIDAYHLSSLVDYLTRQSQIRATLEGELDRHLSKWDKGKRLRRGADIWKDVRISGVTFMNPKTPATIQEATESARRFLSGTVHPPKVLMDSLVANTTPPPPSSEYTLELAADWKDSHVRLACFRDGELDEFRLE